MRAVTQAAKPLLSPSSELTRRLRLLHSPKARREHGSFLLENRRAIEYCLSRGWTPKTLLLGEQERDRIFALRDTDPKSFSIWQPRLDTAIIASAPAILKVSQASTPSGYLAEFPIPDNIMTVLDKVPIPLHLQKLIKQQQGGVGERYNLRRQEKGNDQRLTTTTAITSTTTSEYELALARSVDWSQGGVILDHVSDPANVGTLLRTGAVFGFKQFITLQCADILSYKVVQSTVGALADLRIVSTSTSLLHSLFTNGSVGASDGSYSFHKERLHQQDHHDYESAMLGAIPPLRLQSRYLDPLPNLASLVIENGEDIDVWAMREYASSSSSSSLHSLLSGGGMQHHLQAQPWIVIGSEAHGVSKEVLEISRSKVTIPMMMDGGGGGVVGGASDLTSYSSTSSESLESSSYRPFYYFGHGKSSEDSILSSPSKRSEIVLAEKRVYTLEGQINKAQAQLAEEATEAEKMHIIELQNALHEAHNHLNQVRLKEVEIHKDMESEQQELVNDQQDQDEGIDQEGDKDDKWRNHENKIKCDQNKEEENEEDGFIPISKSPITSSRRTRISTIHNDKDDVSPSATAVGVGSLNANTAGALAMYLMMRCKHAFTRKGGHSSSNKNRKQ